MALSRVKVWGNEILTAADLNAEFNNIINNASSLISPLSGSLDWDGYAHTLDAAGVTTAQSTSSIGWTFIPGSKAGTPSTTGGISNWAASTWTDSATAGSGTATAWVGHAFKQPTLAASNATVTTTDAATVYIANAPAAGSNETLTNAWALWIDDGAVRFDGAATFNSTVLGTPKGAMAPPGLLFGMTLSNNGSDATNDIDIAAGECTSDDTTPANRVQMVLSSSITKRLDAAWAVGTGNGGLDTGAIADTTYHLWVIQRVDTGVVDVLFSTSATSPTMPANYTKKRRIGAVVRASAALLAFTQVGDEYLLTTPILDINATNPGTSAVTRTLASMPTGVKMTAILNAWVVQVGTSSLMYLSALDQTDSAASSTAAPGFTFNASNVGTAAFGMGAMRIRTNTSAQIRSRITGSDANTVVNIVTLGWIDTRGRLA